MNTNGPQYDARCLKTAECGSKGPEQPETGRKSQWSSAQLWNKGMAVVLSTLMILFPMGQGSAFAQQSGSERTLQDVVNPASTEALEKNSQPLAGEQLDQLVAPIALYPDALVAQILAASTYPTQVVEAQRWLKAQGNASPEQIAAAVDAQRWDPSVKALTAFPSVLDQMDRNLAWTTDLGNAYYNQPQDVMAAIQSMRRSAQEAGNLKSNEQQTVAQDNGYVTIVPANPQVVYVPVYDPWVVWGYPVVAYPGYYYYVPPGIYFGGFAIGWGIGIGIGFWGGWGWGWNYWGCNWHNRSVYYNHNRYYTRSTTVISRGFGRPGGPPSGYRQRGSYYRGRSGYDRSGAWGRGSNNEVLTGTGRGFNRGTRPSVDRQTWRNYNRGTSSGADRGTRGGFDRSTGPNVNRGTRPSGSWGTDRGTRRQTRPSIDRNSGRQFERQSTPGTSRSPSDNVRRSAPSRQRDYGTSSRGSSVQRGWSNPGSSSRSMGSPSGSSGRGGSSVGRGGGGGWSGGGRSGGGGGGGGGRSGGGGGGHYGGGGGGHYGGGGGGGRR